MKKYKYNDEKHFKYFTDTHDNIIGVSEYFYVFNRKSSIYTYKEDLMNGIQILFHYNNKYSFKF